MSSPRRIVRLLCTAAVALTLLMLTGVARASSGPLTAFVVTATGVTPINLTASPPTVGTAIGAGVSPAEIAIAPDGLTAYVHSNGTVTPVDLTTSPPTPKVPIPTGGVGSGGIAITPNGATAYVSNKVTNNVTPINLTTNTAGSPIPVGVFPGPVAISPDGATAYVGRGDFPGAVVPIAIATNTVGAPITVGNSPSAIAITPNGLTAYVANYNSGTVTPINLVTHTTGTPITIGLYPLGIAITPDGAAGYVIRFSQSCGASGTVTPIDLATNTAGTPIPLSSDPSAVAIAPDGSTVYVAGTVGFCSANTGSVTPVNIATNTAGTPIALANDTRQIAIIGPAGSPASPPGVPTNLSAVSEDQEVNLSWEPPDNDGGSSVTGYTVSYKATADSVWSSPTDTTDTTADVTGLTNGTGYDFRVQAVNIAGGGDYATISATPVPSSPTPYARLEALVNGLPSSPDAFRQVKKHLHEALRADLWTVAGTTLAVPKGNHFFDRAKQAADTLDRFKSQDPNYPTAQQAESQLWAVANQLAGDAITQATTAGGKANELRAAQNEWNKAQQDWNKDHNSAFDHLKSAWKHAINAIN